jgi:alpha-ketoglutarate-dependent taurine dioxygenase
MKKIPLLNYEASIGCQVTDIDLNSDEEIIELGKTIAENAIVLVDQNITTRRLFDIMMQWGDPSKALCHELVVEKKLSGKHWREIFLHLGYITKEIDDHDLRSAVSVISYRTDAKNKPKGMFTTGKLRWHSDQISAVDAPRVIGLQSVADSNNSQTEFLCTHDAFNSLSKDLKSQIKELKCLHKWNEGVCAPGVGPEQSKVLRLNMVPVDGLVTPLYSTLSSGVDGIHLPTHTFDKFVGMSREESDKLYNYLCKVIYNDKFVYTQNWADGQIVFMDQEITLHRRPTNVTSGSKRNMARVISYLNHIYPDDAPGQQFYLEDSKLTHEELMHLVDSRVRHEYEIEHNNQLNING